MSFAYSQRVGLLAAVFSGAAVLTIVPSADTAFAAGSNHAAVNATMVDGIKAASYGDPGVITFGDAVDYGSPINLGLSAPVVTMAATPDGKGYWLVAADGGVFAYGDAGFYGSAGGIGLYAPIVGMAPTPDGKGYWLVASDGGVFAYGDAAFYGSTGNIKLNDPIVAMVSAPSGDGYWLVADDGGVFAFGASTFYGSMGSAQLFQQGNPVVAIISSADGLGYWLVQGGGEVTPYGDAPTLGQMQGHPPVSSAAPTPDHKGYWLVCDNGEVDAFGDATYHGGNDGAVPTPPVSAIVPTGAGGYWLLDPQAFPVTFSHPTVGAAASIVHVASTQLGPSPDGPNYCNPYGPCEPWCSLFATWVWESNGIPIPRFPFTGSIYSWAAQHTGVLPATTTPAPGYIVLYGTGPESTATSEHTGVVAQVWPDGAIDTVEGDAGPGGNGFTAVVVNGPFLPSQSWLYNGMPIYAFAAT